MTSNSSSLPSNTQPKTIKDFVEESIVKTKLVLEHAKMVHSSVDFKSAADVQTYIKTADDAGLLVLKSSNKHGYPKIVYTLVLYSKTQKTLFPICLEPDSPQHLVEELNDAVAGMPKLKAAHVMLAVETPNVDTAVKSIHKLRQIYGDRLMTSSMPKIEKEKDTEAIVWLVAIANERAHEQASRIA